MEKLSSGDGGIFMKDIIVLYTFMGLMVLNLMASFVYLVGFAQLKARVRKAFQSYRAR
jgi:hypothetical protein